MPAIPPGTTDTVHARRVLVIAPHYDDEALGCGGLLAHLAAQGADIRVGFLSDGGADGALRQAEAGESCRVLGAAETMHLALADGALMEPPAREAAATAIAGWLQAAMPDLLLAPSPTEMTSDHRAAFAAVHDAAQMLPPAQASGLRRLTVLLYEVNHSSHPDLLVDVSAHTSSIAAAMRCYASQQARHDYLGAAIGLRRFRTLTLPPSVTHAEGYRRLTGWDLATRSLAQVVDEAGGSPYAPPAIAARRVSVVVRTYRRPQLLAEALASIARSDYRDLEVVLVNDGGTAPAVPEAFPFPVRRIDHARREGRAAAAQSGVDAASGHYVTFLDDDDLIAPDHVSTLVATAQSSGARVAYTLAAVTQNELDPGRGWRCLARALPYRREFDRDRLLVDNYIPINTIIVERALLHEAGAFDRSLEIFEDWDMLIRLSALAPFRHYPRVTCEYRHFPGASDQALGSDGTQRPDFAATKARVLAKHRHALDPGTLARAVIGLTADVVAADQRRRGAERQAAAAGDQVARLTSERDAERRRIGGELSRVQAEEQRLTAALQGAHAEIGRVTAALSESRSHLERAGDELERVYAEEARLAAVGRDLQDALDRASIELVRVYAEEARLTAAGRDLQDALDRARPPKRTPPPPPARPPIRRASVLIVSWNGRAHLETSLAALFAQQPAGLPWDVWVLDNGSNDDTAAWLRRYHPSVHLVSSTANLGFCAGNNRLATATGADLLLFLNNDTQPHPDWAGELIEALMTAPPDVAAAAGVLVDWSGERLDFGRGAMTFDGHAFQVDSHRELSRVVLPAPGEEQLFACGANMIVRRDSLLAAGGFDDHYFAYYDDVDLGWRLWSGGERIVSAPGAVVRHRGASTGRTLASSHRAFLVERNAFLTAYKNYDAELWAKLMPALMLTLISRTSAMMIAHNPNGAALGHDPFTGDGNGHGNGHGRRGLAARVWRRLRETPALTDGGTIAQVRALSWISRHMDAAAERRAAVQARRCRGDEEIVARFPLHVVPTYPGDEALFASAGFRAWLPDEPRLTFRRLDDLMAAP